MCDFLINCLLSGNTVSLLLPPPYSILELKVEFLSVLCRCWFALLIFLVLLGPYLSYVRLFNDKYHEPLPRGVSMDVRIKKLLQLVVLCSCPFVRSFLRFALGPFLRQDPVSLIICETDLKARKTEGEGKMETDLKTWENSREREREKEKERKMKWEAWLGTWKHLITSERERQKDLPKNWDNFGRMKELEIGTYVFYIYLYI